MIELIEGKRVFIQSGSWKGHFAQIITTTPIKGKIYVSLTGLGNNPPRIKTKNLVDISEHWSMDR